MANALPWNDTAGTTVIRTDAGDGLARAKGLAQAAMEAAAAAPATGPSDYQRAQADYNNRLAKIRTETSRAHVAANNARAEAAALRKAEAKAAHEARNAAAREAARQRRLDKAA